MSKGLNRATGCGCGVILAIVLVVTLVGWLLSFQSGPITRTPLQPIPADVPPRSGAEVPAIDVSTPGRTSDKLSHLQHRSCSMLPCACRSRNTQK